MKSIGKSDLELGMQQRISRRDFVHGASLAALGLVLSTGCETTNGDEKIATLANYPPLKTGMRGSHPGSYEVAHALGREGAQFENAISLDETYDLIIVGAGISGLTAAYAYRKKFGPDARILILDNHDDFGGHAKRNEFEHEGVMRLSWGGTMNLEYLSFSDTVLEFLAELGINVNELSKALDFHYGGDKPAIWFDAETYGRDVLVPGFFMYSQNLDALDTIDQFPLSEVSRAALKQFYASSENVLEGMNDTEIHHVLHKTSYTTFLSEYAELPDEVVELFIKAMDGYWGVQTYSLSAAEAMHGWLPGAHLLGDEAAQFAGAETSEDVAMFPDGNATIARLLVQALIPSVAADVNADNIALAKFDYGELDRPESPIRLRLGSTVVNAANITGGVDVTYVRDGVVSRLRSRHCVLACYHAMIPYLCPELPDTQKEAMRYQVKSPMLLTNVLVRNSDALDRLGISGAYCPGRMHAKVFKISGVNTAGYQFDGEESKAVPLMFWGMMAPPERDGSIHDQLRGARKALLELTFDDFEREVRTVLDGLLGPAGFDAAEDILAITVNRWPHGYSYGYLDLWDPEWEAGKAPHEIARKPIGNISIANSDAAAAAYTQAAIEEALRAVAELV